MLPNFLENWKIGISSMKAKTDIHGDDIYIRCHTVIIMIGSTCFDFLWDGLTSRKNHRTALINVFSLVSIDVQGSSSLAAIN